MYTFLGSPRLRPERRPQFENPDAGQLPPTEAQLFPPKGAARSVEADRQKIRDSGVLDAMLEYIEGRREMEPGQVNAGLSVLRKILPDLSPVALPGGGEDGDEEGAGAPGEVIEFRIVDPKE